MMLSNTTDSRIGWRCVLHVVILQLAVVLIVGSVSAQNVTVTQSIRNVSVSGNVYTFEVWGRSSQSGAPLLFSGGFAFFHTKNALSPISVTLAPTLGTWLCNIGALTDSSFRTGFGSGTTSYVCLPTTDVKLMTISLRINNPTTRANLRWSTENSGWSICDICGEHVAFAGSDNSPLPITLASFTVSSAGGNATLAWTTVSETDNLGFYVERSVDSRSWTSLAFIQGHGTTLVPRTYSYVDETSRPPAFYRLKQVDLDAAVHYSEVVYHDVPLAFGLWQNYPNPFNPVTNIQFTIGDRQLTIVKVYDAMGRDVQTLVNEVKGPGTYAVNFDCSNLASGTYFYRLTAGQYVETRKMVLMK